MARPLDPQKKEAILGAARKIFSRDGYTQAKMSDIAGEAGVAAGTLYLYFNSKEALSNSLAEDFFQRCNKIIDNYLPRIAEPGGIERYIEEVINIATDEKPILSLARIETLEREGPGPEIRRQFQERMASELEKLMDAGVIRRFHAIALSDMIAGMLHKMVMCGVVLEHNDLSDHKATCARILQLALFEPDKMPAGSALPKGEKKRS